MTYTCRYQHWSWGFNIQLHIPIAYRGTAVQLECGKQHHILVSAKDSATLKTHCEQGMNVLSFTDNHTQTNSGLIALGNAAGYFLAIPLTFTSDRLAAYLTRKNNGIREAEMRLGVLLPAMVMGPAGLLAYAMTAQHQLHWMGYFAGVAMVNWGSYFYFSFTLAYAVDSYTANTSEMLIAMNLGKQAISFGMGLHLLDWILKQGYAVVIGGVFVGVLLFNNLLLLVFMFFGKKIRILTSRTWLGGMHKKTAGQVLSH